MDSVAILEAVSMICYQMGILLKIKFLLNDQIIKHLVKLLEMPV